MGHHHDLKVHPRYYDEIEAGTKNFEIRLNDRGFRAGDTVTLREWDPQESHYTGRRINKRIGYVTPFEQKEGYCVFSLLPLGPHTSEPFWQSVHDLARSVPVLAAAVHHYEMGHADWGTMMTRAATELAKENLRLTDIVIDKAQREARTYLIVKDKGN